MTARLDMFSAATDAFKPMLAFEDSIRESGLEHSLIKLVKTRASQINGCAYCLHMHTKDARAAGETEERLYLLSAWRESSFYTPRERAALAWTETLTRIEQTQASDSDFEELKSHFTEREMVELSLAIGAINVWNRLAVGFRSQHPATRVENAA
ncbi:AhpD family alkylhydroperoxidase [Roseibium hamelinense]|uniref:AhpD family alkylhydroperoxidase n=1 Tax=Roseibium hamelinense TaxID=150831 RepID=A0A562T1E3_9HYPH|nr:carboxymuconolactone decarboxylase family protein [Roseibium hamelinense]MTI44507.1 carboxymuconolactone decarboxylase family protein [Roseibium hamelinense]TWI87475.1 AhpD family alkylhydroperoxidase [Roseibium hamelinense]